MKRLISLLIFLFAIMVCSGQKNITLDLKVFLEGPYDTATGTMKTLLLDYGIIPLNQPYNPTLPYYKNPSPKWYYTGNESVDSIPDSVVDWVLIEIRDAENAMSAWESTMVSQKACFLLSDGHIVDLESVSLPSFNLSINAGLFCVVHHRNHASIMSSSPLQSSGGGIHIYDFSSGYGQVYGGALGIKEIATGIWAMASGDANGDAQINGTDIWDAWRPEGGKSGYLSPDFNLDCQVNNIDNIEYWGPNSGSASQVPW